MQRLRVPDSDLPQVVSWRFEPGELVVRFAGAEGECCPLCRCGRAHWFVHERRGPPGERRLQLDCHHCGNRVTFLLDPRA